MPIRYLQRQVPVRSTAALQIRGPKPATPSLAETPIDLIVMPDQTYFCLTRSISIYYQFETKRNYLVGPQHARLPALTAWERISRTGD